MVRLAPGVDTEMFRPGAGGAAIRQRLGIAPGTPVVVCVSRMVPRKGQDTLIRAWPRVLAGVAGTGPRPVLLLVGDGPYQPALRRLARRCGVADSVVFAGQVPWAELPAYYDAGTVFAMPCRTRRLGLDVEGLGIVQLPIRDPPDERLVRLGIALGVGDVDRGERAGSRFLEAHGRPHPRRPQEGALDRSPDGDPRHPPPDVGRATVAVARRSSPRSLAG
jgi:glycosyltransferase involved in cell wall biosynthesis